MPTHPFREVRAHVDDATITVYQAYSPAIADAAVAVGTFVAPFKRDRMTWIKPSFFWMMCRSGWATKLGQERVLAVRISRVGFDRALELASLSHFEADVHRTHEAWRRAKEASPVRVQWDPERDADLQPLSWRAIQIGLGPRVVDAYVDEWILRIDNVTDVARRAEAGDLSAVPVERPYPVSAAQACVAGALGLEEVAGGGVDRVVGVAGGRRGAVGLGRVDLQVLALGVDAGRGEGLGDRGVGRRHHVVAPGGLEGGRDGVRPDDVVAVGRQVRVEACPDAVGGQRPPAAAAGEGGVGVPQQAGVRGEALVGAGRVRGERP